MRRGRRCAVRGLSACVAAGAVRRGPAGAVSRARSARADLKGRSRRRRAKNSSGVGPLAGQLQTRTASRARDVRAARFACGSRSRAAAAGPAFQAPPLYAGPHRTAPAATQGTICPYGVHLPLGQWARSARKPCTTALMLQIRVRAGCGAHEGRVPAMAGLAASSATRARSASRAMRMSHARGCWSSGVFGCAAVKHAASSAAGPQDRPTQVCRRACAPDALPARRSPPARGFAAPCHS